MDKITVDISLRGDDWGLVIEKLYKTVFSTMYQMYVLCAAIGIMYDKQLVLDGKENEEEGLIPRTMQQNNKPELEILFQTAILTTESVNYSEDTRLELAFGDKKPEDGFNEIQFLTLFANFGAHVLANKVTDDMLESLENIKELLVATVKGLNFDINPIDIDSLDVTVEDI